MRSIGHLIESHWALLVKNRAHMLREFCRLDRDPTAAEVAEAAECRKCRAYFVPPKLGPPCRNCERQVHIQAVTDSLFTHKKTVSRLKSVYGGQTALDHTGQGAPGGGDFADIYHSGGAMSENNDRSRRNAQRSGASGGPGGMGSAGCNLLQDGRREAQAIEVATFDVDQTEHGLFVILGEMRKWITIEEHQLKVRIRRAVLNFRMPVKGRIRRNEKSQPKSYLTSRP